jgi:hypothetical protein
MSRAPFSFGKRESLIAKLQMNHALSSPDDFQRTKKKEIKTFSR